LRSLAWLARILNEEDRARQLDAEFNRKRAAMEKLFWRPGLHSYAFAIDPRGRPVDEPSVLATVPMWFHLLDEERSREMTGMLSEERHASDWGMRIISSSSRLYDPSGYHFGSVWPLFTGWASVAEYRYHQAAQAFANLKANAALSLFAGGNTTEVLSGDTATPLSTAAPHQIWSAAMVVSPLLRGMAGLETDAIQNQIHFEPHLPADWPSFAVKGIRVGSTNITLRLTRDREQLILTVANTGTSAVSIDFAPAYPPCAKILSARFDGSPSVWKTELHGTDFHPRFTFMARPGKTELQIRHSGVFGYAIPVAPPRLAEPSSNLKLTSETWSGQGRTLTLAVSGLAGHEYRINLVNPDRVEATSGATRDAGDLIVRMRAGVADKYVPRQITLRLR
jgi:hypothetical protein